MSRLIVAKDVLYDGVLREVRKSSDRLRPLYEAFTNSLEAIKAKRAAGLHCGEINVELYLFRGTTDEDHVFDRLVITDDGMGFDDENFERLTMYKDYRKGFSNRGSGRLQFLHFFRESRFASVFPDGDKFKIRHFCLSKDYIRQNAIIAVDDTESTDATDTGTTLTFRMPLSKPDEQFYSRLSATLLKQEILSQYMLEFCSHRETLPTVKIAQFVADDLIEECAISAPDIPAKSDEQAIELNYSRISKDGRSVETTPDTETIIVSSFAIPWSELESNEIKLTSKNEVAKGTSINLECLTPKDKVDGKRYLFFLSGEYIDSKDGDTRGDLRIPTREEFRKGHSKDIFDEREIVLEDFTSSTNLAILSMHEEIRARYEEKNHDLEVLEEMFLLNPKTVSGLSIKLGESDESILKKVYSEEVKAIAKKDAELKQQIDRLGELDPTAADYPEQLRNISSDVVRTIPLQDRKELTHYVARRKLVLEIFQKILDQELAVQKQGGRNIDEKLLHDLIFKQSSTRPEESDMWLINEEFIYFEGHSNGRLADIKLGGEKMFRDEFSEVEEEYLKSGGEDRTIKRPDVLLFPDEGKCIIIEFKNPDVNVSNHLGQINKYATWIQNYSKEKFQITTFFGYFIGENMAAGDIQAADPHFENAYHLDYLFCPHTPIRDTEGHARGSLYMEAIKYSTLLERARIRNQIFIDKLTPGKESESGSEEEDIVATSEDQGDDGIPT